VYLLLALISYSFSALRQLGQLPARRLALVTLACEPWTEVQRQRHAAEGPGQFDAACNTFCCNKCWESAAKYAAAVTEEAK
jgi:hypothetical protein